MTRKFNKTLNGTNEAMRDLLRARSDGTVTTQNGFTVVSLPHTMYEILYPDGSKDRFNEIRKWATDQFGREAFSVNFTQIEWTFKNEEDAAAFALRWL